MNVIARSSHRGSAAQVLLAAVVLIAVVGVWWIVRSKQTTGTDGAAGEPLVVFVAASNQPVFEAIRKDYERDYGVPLQVQYGPSQTLLAGVEVSKSGDLYLPADDSYLAAAREKKLAAEVFPLAEMQAVVVVPKGNPKRIAKWDDLLKNDVRVALASPEGAAIGKMTRNVLTKSGLWDALNKHKAVETTTVVEVANNVKVGGVDAVLVFVAVRRFV